MQTCPGSGDCDCSMLQNLATLTHPPGLLEDVDAVEEDLLHAAAEGLLVAEEDLAEVAHAAHQHAEVHVQLVELPGQAHPAKRKERTMDWRMNERERERERESNLCREEQ